MNNGFDDRLECIKKAVLKDKVLLITDLSNLQKVTNKTLIMGECSTHGMLHKTVRSICDTGNMCTKCNAKSHNRKETRFVGEIVTKGEISFEVVDVLHSPFISVIDTDFPERGSFTVYRSNLFSKQGICSTVRPLREGCPAYHGVGDYNSINAYLAHSKWIGMFKRCYDIDAHKMPTYVGCTVDEKWWNFQEFASWFYKNYLDDGLEYHLDKDILVKGNKVYSEHTCCFVPRDINILFTSRKNHRGNNLLGVYYKKGNRQYCAQCADGSGGSQVYLGLYKTQDEAFAVYKKFKEEVIGKQANKFKDRISEEVYNTLINYSVEKGD